MTGMCLGILARRRHMFWKRSSADHFSSEVEEAEGSSESEIVSDNENAEDNDDRNDGATAARRQ